MAFKYSGPPKPKRCEKTKRRRSFTPYFDWQWIPMPGMFTRYTVLRKRRREIIQCMLDDEFELEFVDGAPAARLITPSCSSRRCARPIQSS